MPSTTSASRIPALDGLRGLAIILVVVSHVGPAVPLFGGGVVGVTLFFVLSGYLITNILTRQADQGGIRFVKFYARRGRRLLPALLVAVAGSLIILRDPNWWSAAWPALTYTTNYTLLADLNFNYLSHTWSLAVEEHFYLIWPLVVAALPARWRIGGIAALAGTAFVWRGFLYLTEGFDRIYLGTDGNAAALLTGCLLAVAANRLPTPNRRYGIYAVAGLLALSALPYVPIREPLLFLLAAICFLLAAFGVTVGRVNLMALGLFFWVVTNF